MWFHGISYIHDVVWPSRFSAPNLPSPTQTPRSHDIAALQSLWPSETSNLLFVSVNWAILEISCEWNHRVFVFLGLDYLTQNNVLRFICVVALCSFSWPDNRCPWCVRTALCLSPHFGCSSLFANANSTALNVGVQVSESLLSILLSPLLFSLN